MTGSLRQPERPEPGLQVIFWFHGHAAPRWPGWPGPPGRRPGAEPRRRASAACGLALIPSRRRPGDWVAGPGPVTTWMIASHGDSDSEPRPKIQVRLTLTCSPTVFIKLVSQPSGLCPAVPPPPPRSRRPRVPGPALLPSLEYSKNLKMHLTGI